MTEEAWQELKDKKAAPKQNKYLNNAAFAENRGLSAEGTPAVDGEAAVEEPLIKVTLKARGHSDIKIKVRPVSNHLSPHLSYEHLLISNPEHDIHEDDQRSSTKLQA